MSLWVYSKILVSESWWVGITIFFMYIYIYISVEALIRFNWSISWVVKTMVKRSLWPLELNFVSKTGLPSILDCFLQQIQWVRVWKTSSNACHAISQSQWKESGWVPPLLHLSSVYIMLHWIYVSCLPRQNILWACAVDCDPGTVTCAELLRLSSCCCHVD